MVDPDIISQTCTDLTESVFNTRHLIKQVVAYADTKDDPALRGLANDLRKAFGQHGLYVADLLVITSELAKLVHELSA